MSELQWAKTVDRKGRTIWYLSNPDDAGHYAEVIDVGGGVWWWICLTPGRQRDGRCTTLTKAQLACHTRLNEARAASAGEVGDGPR